MIHNYYEILNVPKNADNNIIINAYKQKISKYATIKSLSNEDKNNIKILKIAQYILLNSDLRTKYNKKILNNNEINNIQGLFNDDSIFNYQLLNNNDNSSLSYQDTTTNEKFNETRKNKISSSCISDRIFTTATLHNFHNPYLYNIDIRKQEQTRISK